MTADTRAIIGTMVAVGVSLGGLLSVQFSSVNARLDDVHARIDDLRTELTGRIDALRTELTGRIDALHTELTGRIDAVEGNLAGVGDDLRRFDDRLRAVEIAFGKVDRRLATLERLLLPGDG